MISIRTASKAWTDATPEARNLAETAAKGSYQLGLIAGHENLSGSTLIGKAKRFSAKYAASRRTLLARLATTPGLVVSERREAHGARVLVLRTA